MAAEVPPRVGGTAVDQKAIAVDVDRRLAQRGLLRSLGQLERDRIRSIRAVDAAIVRLSL
jgi:hypothetical protein